MKRRIQIIEEDAARICAHVEMGWLANQKVLLTGASGLLGLYFLACLRHLNLKMGLSVPVVAVVHSEPAPLLTALADSSYVEIVRGDLSETSFIRSLSSFDCIIHAAGYGQPSRFTADPVRTLELNIIGTIELMKKLSPNGKFLFTSSAEVYTGLTHPPFKETQIGTTNTTHPRSCYIEGKRAGEAICQAYRARGVDAKSARIALTYGPGTRPGDTRVLNMLIEKGLKGRIDLMDAGEARRSFLYVADAIEMMWQILLRGKEPIYNVGGEEEISIFELAGKIGSELSASVHKASAPGIHGAPIVVKLDRSLYKKEFGHSKLTPLDQGLRRTVEWQKDLYGAI